MMDNTKKQFEAIDFTRDEIFKYTLSSDINICKEFINRIDPDIDTEGITFAETQHEIIVGIHEKRVLLDIVTRNDRNTIDMEMFRYVPDDLPRTGRYNAAMIDSKLQKNHVPADLPDVTVILLCTYDPFGFGDPIYHVHTVVDEHPEYDYNEGRKICIVTNQGYEKAPEELKPVIWLLTRNTEPIDDPFYMQIRGLVEQAKTDPEVRRQIMLEIEKERAIRRESFKEGRNEERRESVKKMMKTLRDLGLSAEEIRKKLMEAYPEDEEMIREILGHE